MELKSTETPPRGLTFAAKLALTCCALVLLTGAAVAGLAFSAARQSSADLSNSLLREVSARAAAQTDAFLARAVPLVESLGQLAGNGLAVHDHEQLARQLLILLRANPGI